MHKTTAGTGLLILTLASMLLAGPVRGQDASAAAWKKCQSSDADQRIAGCTEIIDRKGAPRSRLVQALDGRCWAYHVKGEYQLAIKDCNAAIALQPGYSYAYNNLGIAYMGLGDFTKALVALNQAIALKPNFKYSRVGRGKALEALGRTSEAAEDYRVALALDPNNPEAQSFFATPAPANPTAKNLPSADKPATVPIQPPVQTAVAAPAQQLPPSQSVAKLAGRRVALLIGNSKYQAATVLRNPLRDAALIAAELRRVGFDDIDVRNDLTREQLSRALQDFSRKAAASDWAFLYYSGHGIEVSGVNYLIPIDARLQVDRDVEFETVSIGLVMSAVEGARRLRLVVLDACRDNPFLNQMRRTAAVRSVGRGLAQTEPETGSLVVYSAKHGETALDGEDDNSPFAQAFAARLATPGLEVRRLFDLVRDDVLAKTARRQQPFSYGSLSGSEDFYFASR